MKPVLMRQITVKEPGGVEVLQVSEAPIPTVKEGDLLVRVHAAGVNRPDIIQRRGYYPLPPGASPVLGLEVAGEVVDVSRGVAGFKVGDRVCGLTNGGGYADYCLLPHGQAFHIPAKVSFEQAAAIPEAFFTVWANLFQIGRARQGEKVLVHGGTSGIGTTAIMLAKAFGLEVFATARGRNKKLIVQELGAIAIDYQEEDFVRVIASATNGFGVNIIIDIVGAPYLGRNLEALSCEGRLIIIGLLGGMKNFEGFNLQVLMRKQAIITGSMLRSRTPEQKAEIARALVKNVSGLWESGRCLPVIHKAFPMEKVREAHSLMESNEHIGKIVLSMV